MSAAVTERPAVSAEPVPERPVRFRGAARNILAGITAAVLGAALWELISLTSDGWVPGVGEIAASAVELLGDGEFYGDAWISLRRVLTVLLAATLAGLVLGLLAGFSSKVDSFLRPILVTGLAIPDPVYIILVILILGISETSGIVALTIAIVPLVANVVISSVQARDRGLDEMAATYRLSHVDYLRHVLAGQVRPAIVAALRTSFAFSWKLVVLMETMTQSDGVGARIYESFRFLRPADMIAYALLFIVLMRVLEMLALRRLERSTVA
ncbi:ABC transporter permease [Geodermatophilus sabuli]|uniref:NitT/TauT family transport system permease protein n=1 Tax=Geodermatophilus sabuli TaxID=1564158 RepID=A0A285EB68_9ACTN|nr:ABC transporter permease subunit [Geodermatophilus sabuli]MBB3085287.1 NitT/TauT family transport system permease protein [Geodermatophilus sabuli]SNX96285.1 NitT/TauT family transport system permease protein [Geodermatophilus sabuli]